MSEQWPHDNSEKHAEAARKGWRGRMTVARMQIRTLNRQTDESLGQRRTRQEEIGRVLYQSGQTRKARRPVEIAEKREAEALQVRQDTISRQRRGKASWDDVDSADKAWKAAANNASEARALYQTTYRTAYAPTAYKGS